MVVIKEYRIIMPMTVEEYRIGQLYMTANTQMMEALQENGAGVELTENKQMVFEDMGKGILTKKIFHIDRRFPPWLRAVAPKSGCTLYEESKNCFPITSTTVTLPLFAKFKMRIDSVHYADRGETENIHKLSDELLKKRKVVFIDIAKYTEEEKKKKMYDGDNADASTFKSKVTGRGPLKPDWQQQSDPVMCAYKLVYSEFDYFGLQGKVEEFMHTYEHGLFVAANRQLFCWIDEWYGLSLHDVREYEKQVAERTNLITAIKEGRVTDMKISDLPVVKPVRTPVPSTPLPNTSSQSTPATKRRETSTDHKQQGVGWNKDAAEDEDGGNEESNEMNGHQGYTDPNNRNVDYEEQMYKGSSGRDLPEMHGGGSNEATKTDAWGADASNAADYAQAGRRHIDAYLADEPPAAARDLPMAQDNSGTTLEGATAHIDMSGQTSTKAPSSEGNAFARSLGGGGGEAGGERRPGEGEKEWGGLLEGGQAWMSAIDVSRLSKLTMLGAESTAHDSQGVPRVKMRRQEQRQAMQGECECAVDGCGKFAQYRLSEVAIDVCSIECKIVYLEQKGVSQRVGLPLGWESRVDKNGSPRIADARTGMNATSQSTAQQSNLTNTHICCTRRFPSHERPK